MILDEVITDTEHAKDRQHLFEDLYEQVFPKVAKVISQLGGSFDDAKDIFHDALVIYYEKTMAKDAEAIQLPEAYLIGIAKHLWLRKFKNDYKKVSLDKWEQQISIPEEYVEEESDRLLSLLERSGKKCLELLSSFYYEQLSLDSVSKKFGFANRHSVSAQKYKCIDKIRAVIKEKFLRYEDFVE